MVEISIADPNNNALQSTKNRRSSHSFPHFSPTYNPLMQENAHIKIPWSFPMTKAMPPLPEAWGPLSATCRELKFLRLACEDQFNQFPETESPATESKLPGFDPSCELPVVEADFPAQPPVPLNAQPPPGKKTMRSRICMSWLHQSHYIFKLHGFNMFQSLKNDQRYHWVRRRAPLFTPSPYRILGSLPFFLRFKPQNCCVFSHPVSCWLSYC